MTKKKAKVPTEQEFAQFIANKLRDYTDKTGNVVTLDIVLQGMDHDQTRANVTYNVKVGKLDTSCIGGYST